MIITVYSRKGGQGKTSISVSKAKYTGGNIVTNDYENDAQSSYEDVLPGRILELKPGQTSFDIDDTAPVIFDCGGIIEDRVSAFAKISDLCIVPIHYRGINDVKAANRSINSLKEFCKNIVIVITDTDDKLSEELQESLKANHSLPVFNIRKSAYIQKLGLIGTTIFDLYKDSSNLSKTQILAPMSELLDLYNYVLSEDSGVSPEALAKVNTPDEIKNVLYDYRKHMLKLCEDYSVEPAIGRYALQETVRKIQEAKKAQPKKKK